MKNDGQNRHKKRVRQPHNTRERQRHIVLEQGEVLMPPGNGNHVCLIPLQNYKILRFFLFYEKGKALVGSFRFGTP